VETGRSLLQEFVLVPLQNALTQFLAFVPSILGALLILLVGGLIAKLLEHLIVRSLKLLTVDRLADQVQLSNVLAKGGVRRKLSELIGAIVYWFIMLAFVMTALNALNLTVAAELFQRIVAFLPNVVAAVFILIVGIFSAAFLSTTVRTAASNVGVAQAHLIGQAVQVTVVVFAFVAALQQLQIQFVGEVFLIILGGASLGCALAFGLGCRDRAGKWVDSLVDQLQSRKR
jgi:small-conductance mechanosensitive channel